MWLIEHPELLSDKYRKHIDQISFGLACTELDLAIEHLSIKENYPTHSAVNPKPDLSPSVVHYHSHVDPSHLLKRIGQPKVDIQIDEINNLIRKRRQKEFDNITFWNYRYAEHPDLGSGIGSRNQSLELKHACLVHLNDTFHPASVLDVGCGDLEVSRDVTFKDFTGLDVSEQALRGARNKRPDWSFIQGDPIATETDPRSLVLCLDVLIHQASYTAYLALLGRLLSLADRQLVVSGYNQSPWHSSEITFYYEPLSLSLRKMAPEAQIEIIGGYRDTTIIQMQIEDPSPFRQDLYETRFGMLWSRPDDLISEQFLCYGAHTRNAIAMLLSLINRGDTIVDIGAHIGSFAVPLARAIGTTGHLVCVEPNPVKVGRLAQNLILNNCLTQTDLRQGLVAPANRYVYVPTDRNSGAGYFLPDDNGQFTDAISLDSLCSATVPNLIKIDVEGMEVAVLRSGESTIDTHRPLLYIKVAPAMLTRYGSSIEELESWLRLRDYRMFRNTRPRNSDHGDYLISEIESLSIGVSVFDCLAIPSERLHDLAAQGNLPSDAMARDGSNK